MDGITKLECNMKEMMLRGTLSSLEEMDAMSAVVRSLEELVRGDVPYLVPRPPPLPHPPSNVYPQPVITSIQAAPISQGQEDDIPDVQRLSSGMTGSTDHLLGYSFTPPPDRPVTPPPPPAHPPVNITSRGQHVNLPVVKVPDGVTQRLSPVGYLNGEMVYAIRPVASSTPLAAAPQLSSSTTKRRQRNYQHKDGRPYVKKSPNPFMLFLKEQRPILLEQFVNRGSREVTTMLGETWKAMSSAEQDKYYQESYRLKRLHYQQPPDWIPNSSKKTRSD